jgi:hypothetical protein
MCQLLNNYLTVRLIKYLPVLLMLECVNDSLPNLALCKVHEFHLQAGKTRGASKIIFGDILIDLLGFL